LPRAPRGRFLASGARIRIPDRGGRRLLTHAVAAFTAAESIMKNTCPQCGTAYNVTPAAIGRKVACKNCGAALVVTEAGLEYQNAPAPAAAAPGGSAFDFDAGRGDEGDDPRRKPPRPAKAGRRSRRDDDDGEDDDDRDRGRRRRDDDGDDDRPRKKAKKQAGGGFVSDFLFFREFIAPWVVKVLFWVAIVGLLLGAVVFFVVALISGKVEVILGAVVGIIVFVPVYMLLIRVYAELILLGFAIYDRLGEIRDRLPRQEPPPASETK
jgi:predicted Zn finger-like uncharacterized protein